MREAAGWYDRRAAGLGDTFVDLVSQAVAEIITDPERFAPGQTECRYIRVSRFPYVVIFDVTDVDILLLGVLHTARTMDKWRERQSDA